jgi:hypothetical protein
MIIEFNYLLVSGVEFRSVEADPGGATLEGLLLFPHLGKNDIQVSRNLLGLLLAL